MAQNVGQRHLPDTENVRRCYAVESAMFLAKHTLDVCKNPNIFVKEHEDLTERIRQTALSIYLNAYNANKTKLNKAHWDKREPLQIEAIRLCNELIGLINLAAITFHLRRKKKDYWVNLAVKTKDLLVNWHSANLRAVSFQGVGWRLLCACVPLVGAMRIVRGMSTLLAMSTTTTRTTRMRALRLQ